jgi:hypothetical protein
VQDELEPQEQMRLVDIDDDGTSTVFVVAPGATRGLGASSADGGQVCGKQLRNIACGQREVGLCRVVGCQYPEMQSVCSGV